LSDLSVIIQGWADYEIAQEQKDLISSIIEDLIAENDAEQIAKSKLVFVEDFEEQIAPTKKTKAKKVVTPVGEDLPDFIDIFSIVKDLPEPVRKLMGLRRKQDNDTSNVDLDATLSGNLTLSNTLEGVDFWAKINNEGDLREFKKLYGNKGEKVDDLIEFAEINEFVEGLIGFNELLELADKKNAPAPAVKTRKPRTPKPVPVVAPVVTPKVSTPKPVKVVAPKIIPPKPAKVVAPKVVKQKVTKPKVEDDLSFLDDLDNIF
jgi:hypothetical protein